MAYFARVQHGLVVDVHTLANTVLENEAGEEVPEIGQAFLSDLYNFPAQSYIQTSYNTYGGVHLLGGTPLRKNYAGVGFSYDEARDAFIPPQPSPNCTLDEDTCLWVCPEEDVTNG